MAKKAKKNMESEDRRCLDWACVGRLNDIVEEVKKLGAMDLPFISSSDVSPYTWYHVSSITRTNIHRPLHPRIYSP